MTNKEGIGIAKRIVLVGGTLVATTIGLRGSVNVARAQELIDYYTVQMDDTLENLAEKWGTESAVIDYSNGLGGKGFLPGRRIINFPTSNMYHVSKNEAGVVTSMDNIFDLEKWYERHGYEVPTWLQERLGTVRAVERR